MAIEQHPHYQQIIDEVQSGKTSIRQAAQDLGLSYTDFWRHVNKLVSDKKIVSNPDRDSDIILLREILYDLRDKTKDMMSVFEQNDKRILPAYVREIRNLVMDVNKLLLDQLGSPRIIIQQFMNQQTELQTFMLEELCSDCKAKVLKHFEKKNEILTRVSS